jgi:general secretion pathway protein K
VSFFSKPWKISRRFFQSLEETRSRNPESRIQNPRSGSALIVALWVLIILSLLVGAFAFDMHVEAGITSYYRKRLKAQYLAYAGVEYAKVILSKDSSKEELLPEGEEAMNNFRKALEVGGEVNVSRELGGGEIKIDLKPESAGWGVKEMSDDEWKVLLEVTGVPLAKIDELIDCYRDYTDPGDEHRLNGAESDDPYYEQRGYACKNGPIDSVDELLRIKGFTPAIVYGGPAEEEGEEDLDGIADVLTIYGSDKIKAMSAPEKALAVIEDLNSDEIRRLIQARVGADGKLPESLQELLGNAGIPQDFDKKLDWGRPEYVEVTSVGEVHGVQSTVVCTLHVDGAKSLPVAWREGDIP